MNRAIIFAIVKNLDYNIEDHKAAIFLKVYDQSS